MITSDDLIIMDYTFLPVIYWKMNMEVFSDIRHSRDRDGKNFWKADLGSGSVHGSGTLFNIPIVIVEEKCFQLEIHIPDKEPIISKYEGEL